MTVTQTHEELGEELAYRAKDGMEVGLLLVRGKQNAITAVLTGSLKVQGDLALASKLDKLLSPLTSDPAISPMR